jgi:hypothetical protein
VTVAYSRDVVTSLAIWRFVVDDDCGKEIEVQKHFITNLKTIPGTPGSCRRKTGSKSSTKDGKTKLLQAGQLLKIPSARYQQREGHGHAVDSWQKMNDEKGGSVTVTTAKR